MSVSNRQLVRGLVVGMVLALGVLTALTVIGDARELRDTISQFKWAYLIPIFGLTIWNYWWRFRKWERSKCVSTRRSATRLSVASWEWSSGQVSQWRSARTVGSAPPIYGQRSAGPSVCSWARDSPAVSGWW